MSRSSGKAEKPKLLLMNGPSPCSWTSAVSFLKSGLKAFPNWWSICRETTTTINFAMPALLWALFHQAGVSKNSLTLFQKWVSYVPGCVLCLAVDLFSLLWIRGFTGAGSRPIVASWQLLPNKSDQYEQSASETKTKLIFNIHSWIGVSGWFLKGFWKLCPASWGFLNLWDTTKPELRLDNFSLVLNHSSQTFKAPLQLFLWGKSLENFHIYLVFNNFQNP